MDPALFVVQAVRDTQQRAQSIDQVVASQNPRVRLTADRALPGPDMRAPTPGVMLAGMPSTIDVSDPDMPVVAAIELPPLFPSEAAQADAPDDGGRAGLDDAEPQAQNAPALPVKTSALSFRDQLRAGASRLPASGA
jgi:hypothetical protein